MGDSQSGKLLAHLGVRARLLSYHDANESARAARLVDEIAGGARVALVSDAGMPAVSDPGHDLIGACLERGLEVEVVPGPSAVLAALVVSGLPADRFCFEGFPPRKPAARARVLAELAGERLAEQGERGEFTLVVAGAPEAPAAVEVDVVAEVAGLIETGASTRDAVDQVARATGRPRRAVYQAVLEAREFASLRGQNTIDAQQRRSGGQGQSQERNR